MKVFFLKNIVGIFWPPFAPVMSDEDLASNPFWWAATCVLSVSPIAAVLHHALFYYQQCMLNPFSTSYQVTWPVLRDWLKYDPSLPWAIIAAFVIYRVGRRFVRLKILLAPLLISFSLLSLWVWDIFILNRPICRHLHDGRFEIWRGFPLRGRHFYVLGVCLYIAFLIYLVLQYRKSCSRDQLSEEKS